ncbi:hypothetical protein [Pseudidiomarina aquimaris]|uniref:hypothetical protein n=1 Tax=Pseudidiomarina aquimaris TaxID=641841 RepID=UPI003A977DCD
MADTLTLVAEVGIAALLIVVLSYVFRLRWRGFAVLLLLLTPIITFALVTWHACFIFSTSCANDGWMIIAHVNLALYIILAAVVLNWLRTKFLPFK